MGALTAVVRVPLRVSFVGGGSDLPGAAGGKVVTTTIDRYVWCVARARDDDKVYLTWREKEIVDDAAELRHDLARACLCSLGVRRGVEVLTFADVPGVGSGLGSSAATTVAILMATMLARCGRGPNEIDRQELARWACEIELDALRRPGGQQDQHAVALGGMRLLAFDHAGEVTHSEKVQLDAPAWRALNERFMLFAAAGERGRAAADVLAGFRDSAEFRGACAFCAEQFWAALMRRDWERAAELVARHHELKRAAFPGYWPAELAPVEERLAGLRYKLCGAGGTGHLLVACSPATSAATAARVEAAWGPRRAFRFADVGPEVVFVGS